MEESSYTSPKCRENLENIMLHHVVLHSILLCELLNV
jgi:hypothetical protein